MPKFEVQIHKDKRWITQQVTDYENEAIDVAKKAVASKQVEGARVISDRIGYDGLHRERVVFEEMVRDMPTAPVRISPVEDAPLCEAVEDVYKLDARITIARLLRKYLEQQSVIPSELLYCYSPLSKLQDADGQILPSALDRIVTLNCRDNPDLNAKDRRDLLWRWFEEVGRRSRRCEGERMLWKAKLSEFAKARQMVEKVAFDPEEQLAHLRHVVARELYKERNFLAKLEALLSCVSADLDMDVLHILDGFIADTLAMPQVIQDILGNRPNLSAALVGLLDLMDGRTDSTAVDDEPETVQVLRKLFAEGRLPAGRFVLMDRVSRELGGKNPLARNDPAKEHEAFCALLIRLVRRDGVAGGPAVAGALTRRYGLRVKEGGQVGWRMSIQGVSNLLKDRAKRLHYLIAVADAAEGISHTTAVSEEVVTAVKDLGDIHDIVDRKLSMTEKLQIIGGLQRNMQSCMVLPEVLRTRVIGRIDDLVASFLTEEQVIEKLDDPTDPLRVRAVRLVRFCGSGILVEGKALQLARARVLHHLRQPNFIEDFTSTEAVPAEKEGKVREFYRLLAESGFST